MSVSVPRDVAAQLVAQAARTDGSDRALDKIAAEHGLMLPELKQLLARAQKPSRRTPETRVCNRCGVEKPITDYYKNAASRGGRMAHCITCNNKRPPTEARMVRNRARSRAYAVLADRHREEFDEIYAAELEKARAEHAAVQAVAAAKGNPDAKVARLRRGPKREGETSVLQRLDVARCPKCHTHHDAGHVCPGCGHETTAPTSGKEAV